MSVSISIPAPLRTVTEGESQVSIGAEFVGALDVSVVAGAGHDDNDEVSKGFVAANPFEDFEAVGSGHF